MKNIGFAVLVVVLSFAVFSGIRAYQNKRAAEKFEREAEAEAKELAARRKEEQERGATLEDCMRARRNLAVLQQAAAKGSDVTLMEDGKVVSTRAARDLPYVIGDTERYIARNCGRR